MSNCIDPFIVEPIVGHKYILNIYDGVYIIKYIAHTEDTIFPHSIEVLKILKQTSKDPLYKEGQFDEYSYFKKWELIPFPETKLARLIYL